MYNIKNRYLNRVVPRSEIAKRCAVINSTNLKNVFYEWFYDAVKF